MANTSVDQPQFTDDPGDLPASRPYIKGGTRGSTARPNVDSGTNERKVTLIATLDKPILLILGLLVTVGMMMVYSTTFFWSVSEWGTETVLLMRHVQNLVVGLLAMAMFTLLDYRLLRRMAVIIRNMLVEKQSYTECRDAMISRRRKQLHKKQPKAA